ncbi:MAG TPA: hypothetical protein VHE83_02900 [Mycobacteriales bacterium]|nr:hypothetical protein [Mycobacteriales bacterium]
MRARDLAFTVKRGVAFGVRDHAPVPRPPSVVRTGQAPTASVYAISRRRNEPTLRRLMDDAQRHGWPAHVWALDGTDGGLGPVVRGTGSGDKFTLLQRLLDEHPPREGDHVVIADDDVTVVHGDLSLLLRYQRAAGLDLAQPAHARFHNVSHGTTVRRVLTLVRHTTFVEIGPLFVIAPHARPKILPFPADAGMGWVLNISWVARARTDLVLGVVDGVLMEHHGKIAVEYDDQRDALEAGLAAALAAAGYSDLTDAQRRLGSWYRWQRTAPWVR